MIVGKRSFRLSAIAMALVVWLPHGGANAAAPLPGTPTAAVAAPALADIAAELRNLAISAAAVTTRTPRPYDERDWLARFYVPRAYAPAWQDRGYKQAAAAIALLQNASVHGLSPAEYNADGLARQLADPVLRTSARFDAAMTQAMLHYLADLRVGRVRSEYHTTLPDPRLTKTDPVEQLRAALLSQHLDQAVAASEPRIPLYRRVMATLATYRKLAEQPFTPLPPLPQGIKKLEPGAPYAGVATLRARLIQLGDLSATAPAEPPASAGVYTTALAEGVKHFQSRHALNDDGVIGAGTLAALNVPLAQRVRQLELGLERLRWLPDFPDGRLIAVNLPSFRLWALELGPGAKNPLIEMRVIVGAAVKTPTPLFVGSMRYVEFNPYWNVPRSIEKGEIIPKLARDPGYLGKNEMELVPVGGGAAVSVVDAATLDGLRAGQFRVRQRPGPRNALGAVKFAMPNTDNIYLHSTSAQSLFKRGRRDLSHGCIRVENPLGLARFVFADQPQMTPAVIDTLMKPAPMKTVSLKTPIPVVLFYSTAVTDREGLALFPEDVYKRDPALEKALKVRSDAIAQVR
ncbi:L,D-transpeptidase family protein [Massilia antarctica]|uniref:L,D-transpeptidase family protein n=1 Tax=Massilia antarctica TaxID=2765360 RepID=UPI0006BB81A9|nr:L,D-transpeptidase family protein [Massilia sp. H27-R4]MCY0914505.1 L,D-transpeptidase family protein [Massilia sp. H27-R4]CUI03106.1 L,D-transpeptidase YcbB [Janthinobacterium sp. CG23_2]CUU26892.1 L,D-transpeptidase YcbB [Janthinobacterium sp. CG23_2]